MKTPSRPPEGVPGNCPVCGAVICLEPSGPVGDVPCPYCGQLLWFVQLWRHVKYFRAEDVAPTVRRKIHDVIAAWARKNGRDLWYFHDLDSLDMVELILDLETELGVTISLEDARNLKNVGDVIDHIVHHEHWDRGS
jgi:acyl carrier protein